MEPPYGLVMVEYINEKYLYLWTIYNHIWTMILTIITISDGLTWTGIKTNGCWMRTQDLAQQLYDDASGIVQVGSVGWWRPRNYKELRAMAGQRSPRWH